MPPGGSSKHDGSAGGHTGTGHDRVYLPKYKENTGRPGRHIRQDRRQYRAWELADAGFRFRNPPPAPYGIKKESRGGKWGGIIPGKKKVQSVISA